MSRPGSDLASGEKVKLCFICALFIVTTIVTAARAANSAPVTAPAGTADHQFIKSTFGVVGKDPFFPRSTRITGAVPVTTPDLSPAPVTALILKGISGPKNHRLAIINNKTVEPGEETEIKVSGQNVRVKCVEIRDDGVTVSVNGQIQKLLLKP